MSRPVWWNLPNQLTLGRIVLAFVLFALLALEISENSLFSDRSTTLWLSIALFVVCVLTDWLDGHYARKLNQVTAFGRIADPFADKLLVLGTLIFLIPISPLIPAWFVVILLAREFLVSGLRSYMESQGVAFGARGGGKLKMICQSLMIPFVLFVEAFDPDRTAATESLPLVPIAQFLIGATLLITLVSMIDYMIVAMKAEPARAEESSP